MARLREEGIVHLERNHRYAAPAGPPDRATNAQLGAELRRRREEAGLTWHQLADTGPVLSQCWATCAAHRADEIRAAEAGTWHPRDFWAELDATLSVCGDLLSVHDHLYALHDERMAPGTGPTTPGTPRGSPTAKDPGRSRGGLADRAAGCVEDLA